MAAPFVVTSRLGNILQMIALAHQTGILRVIRGQGATREMGQIRFIDGEPVSVLLGQLTGEAALGVLNNWGECFYAFDEVSVADVAATSLPRHGIAEGTPGSYSQYPVANSGPYGGSANYRPPTGPFDPANPSTPPYRPDVTSLPRRLSPTSPLPEASWPIYSYQDSGLFSSSGGQPAASGPLAPQPPFAPPSQYTPPYTPPASMPSMPTWEPAQGQAVSTILLTAVPQRTALAEQVEQLPLDRRERMVLLLVDGHRTVADLSRLTRRAEAEVQAVVMHLELLGLVAVGG